MIGLQDVVINQLKPLNTIELTKQPVSLRTLLILWDEQTRWITKQPSKG